MDHPQPQITFDPASVRKVARGGLILVAIIVVAAIALSSAGPYTDYLWFTYDARHPEVLLKGYQTKGFLFLVAFPICWAFIWFNLRTSLSLSMIFMGQPDSMGQILVGKAMKWFQDSGSAIVRFLSPFVAFLFASSFSNSWFTYLTWRNGQPFGKKDPMFGLDASFFVFTLPWLQTVSSHLLLLIVGTTVLSLGLTIGMQTLSALAKIELNRPSFRTHIGWLIGLSLVAFAVTTWINTYTYVLAPSSQFTGAGYVESQQMVIGRILAILMALVGIGSILFARRGRAYTVPIVGGMFLAAFWFLGIFIYPTVVRRLVVDPDRLGKEGPYASRAVDMTRYAYGLDKIDIRNVDATPTLSQKDLNSSTATLDNMRLWDPEILRRTLETLQGYRPYYRFEDVDIDRYTIDGKQKLVMLSARDINLDGLQSDAQNWTNLRLRYTHGYGIAMTQVNRTSSEGRPEFLFKDIPVDASSSLELKQPRIYFSDWRDGARQPTSDYALVNTDEPELDYEVASGPVTSKWSGTSGVPISGLLARLAFSIVLADGNLLVSPNVKGGAKLLMRRNVLERANTVFPFLKFDSDPYLVVLNGKLIWILDGYSSTDMFPYAASYYGLNYIRNSTKVTIDAYSGEMNAYAIEPDEPLLKTFRAIYPNLIKDVSAAPAGLDSHYRYPEDLLSAQSYQLQTYHVKDPVTFLSNSDAWNIALERDIDGQRAALRPYYVEMQLPDEPQSGFLQILPFTPNGKPNMSGWLAAHCDPGHYGRLTLYRYTGATPVKGPEQMESDFNSTTEISEINRQFNNDQSVVIPGNLLVMPIGKGVMYVEPLFLQSRTVGIQSAPRLSWVVLSMNEEVVVGRTYEEALSKLRGGQVPDTTTTVMPPVVGRSDARTALELLNKAEAAQRAGDWAKYGELQKSLKATLEKLAGPVK